MMFWSRTQETVHNFTKKKDCYVTLEDTVLGAVADGLTWCGKDGSNGKTFMEMHNLRNLLYTNLRVGKAALVRNYFSRRNNSRLHSSPLLLSDFLPNKHRHSV